MKARKTFVATLLMSAFAWIATSCGNTNPPSGPNVNPNPDPDPETETYDGNGSFEEPYSVRDFLTISANGKMPDKDAGTQQVWVEAYIVGSYNYNNDPKWVIGASGASNTSLLLADTAESTNTFRVVTVKLADDGFRTALNLKDKPENYQKLLKVRGTMEKYCGVGGVVNIDSAYVDGVALMIDKSTPSATEPTNVEAVSIADFLQKEDGLTYYELTGDITEIDNATYGNFTLQDATGKVAVYGLTAKFVAMKSVGKANNDKSFASLGLKKGDNITIRGTKYLFTPSSGSPYVEVVGGYFVKKNASGAVTPTNNYMPVTAQADITAGEYVIAALSGDTMRVMNPISSTKNYGYIYCSNVKANADGSVATEADNVFTLEADGSNFYIKDKNGRYYYMDDSHNSFQVSATKPAAGGAWTFTMGSNNEITVTNVDRKKWIQYVAKYVSYGSYDSAQEQAALPRLFRAQAL